MALLRPPPPALSVAPPQNTLLPSDWPVAQMTTSTHTKKRLQKLYNEVTMIMILSVQSHG